ARKTAMHVVSSDYFRTMGITLLKGRSFTDDDKQAVPKALVINSALAKKLFGQEEPIGRRIIFEGGEPKPVEVVGVVDDERVGELDEEAVAVAYRPYLQEPWTKLNLVIRTAGDSGNVVNAVRGGDQALDPNLALSSVGAMNQHIYV